MSDWRQDRDRALLALESSKKSDVRLQAARLLLDLATDSDVPADQLAPVLPRLLEDPDERIRAIAVALAPRVLPVDEAEDILAARAGDPSRDVRLEAVGQLADLERPSTRPVLATALDDPDFSVRFEAARGMVALRHSAGLDVLVQALDRDHLRFRALGALAELGDDRALPAIRRLHRRWFLNGFERTQAAGAMARLGDPEGGTRLLERTRRRRGGDRSLAVELLGEVKAEGAFERLREILEDPRDRSRGAAARGLGRLGDPRAVPVLLRVLEARDESADLRLDAAEGLCLLGDSAVRAQVEAAAAGWSDPDTKDELRAMLEDYR